MMHPLADLLVGCVLGAGYVWLLWVWRGIPRWLWVWSVILIIGSVFYIIYNGIKVLELLV